MSVKNGKENAKPFRNIVSDINVKHTKQQSQAKNGFVPYHRYKIYPPAARLLDYEISGD